MQRVNSTSGKFVRDRLSGLSGAVVDALPQLPASHESANLNGVRLGEIVAPRAYLQHLAEAMDAGSPELFVEYVQWVQEILTGLDHSDHYLQKLLEAMARTLTAELPNGAAVDEYFQAATQRLENESETAAAPQNPLADLAQDYTEALLAGKRQAASEMIMAAVAQGVTISDIYLHVFAWSQQEIGRLWQMNEISVAQEHYCTAVTQSIMSQLYPHIFATEKSGRTLVAASVGGNLHEIGIRIVTDMLEMDGWDTYYLGANTPAESVLDSIDRYNADLIAISATLTLQVSKVAALIERVRQHAPNVNILVGGIPFNIDTQLWQRVGADGYAADARQALQVADKLVPVAKGAKE